MWIFRVRISPILRRRLREPDLTSDNYISWFAVNRNIGIMVEAISISLSVLADRTLKGRRQSNTATTNCQKEYKHMVTMETTEFHNNERRTDVWELDCGCEQFISLSPGGLHVGRYV